MKVIKRILIIILLIIIFIVAGFLYKGHELYKQALEKISISDKVAEIKSDENYTKIEDMSEFYKDAVIAVEDRWKYNNTTTCQKYIFHTRKISIKKNS